MLDLGPLDLVVPVIIIIIAIIYLPITFVVLLGNLEFSKLTSRHAFQQAWFERFWVFFGSASKPLFAKDVEATLDKVSGVVLDVGTGSGDWLYLFAPPRNKHISTLILLEPNRNFHEVLRLRAEKLGLAGRYEIIDGGIKDLERIGIQTGTIDTITTIHVLCSVEAPQALIKELYAYLKPGGQWLVYEHIKIRNEKTLAAHCQDLINIAWPTFLDGCSLTRNTEDLLLQAGEWKSADLRPGSKEGRFNQLPHTVGCLVKRGS